MKKIAIQSVIITFFTLSLISCSDVLDNTYSKKTAGGDLERIMAIRRLDSTDYQLMTEYMLKKGLIEPDLMHIDQSYKEILEEAKNEKLMAAKKLESSKKRSNNTGQFQMDQLDHLYDALVILPENSTIRKDWSNRNAFFYKMVFINPSEKAIKAFKGKFTFYDSFETELKSVVFTYNSSVAPYDTMVYDANIDLSTTVNNTIYYTKDFSDIKVIWRPSKVLYEDGSIAE